MIRIPSVLSILFIFISILLGPSDPPRIASEYSRTPQSRITSNSSECPSVTYSSNEPFTISAFSNSRTRSQATNDRSYEPSSPVTCEPHSANCLVSAPVPQPTSSTLWIAETLKGIKRLALARERWYILGQSWIPAASSSLPIERSSALFINSRSSFSAPSK